MTIANEMHQSWLRFRSAVLLIGAKTMKNATSSTVLGVALALAGPMRAESPQKLSFANPAVNIGSAAQDGAGEIVLRSDAGQSQPPAIDDWVLPNPPTAKVTFQAIEGSAPSGNTWRYKVSVLGLSPANTVQQHYAKILGQVLPYVITNQPAGSFAWSISKLPDPWVATTSGWGSDDNACTGFTVIPKDSPATRLKLAASTLIEQSTKESIPVTDLRLCGGNSDCAKSQTEPIDLPANTPSELRLCTIHTLRGNFHGSVILASLQKPDGDTILQNASFSSFPIKLQGTLLICLGVLLAWWAKVWAQARLQRDQALMPALVQRAQLTQILNTLDGLQPAYRAAPSRTRSGVKTLLGEISDSVLDSHQFLPPKFPSPYGYAVDAAGYKAYLEARNPKIMLYSALLTQGIVLAAAEDKGTLTAAQQTIVSNEIGNIDLLGTQLPCPTPDQAFQSIQPILARLHATLYPPPVGLAALTGAPLAPPATEMEVLQLQIESISKGIWLLYGILTAASGVAVLIMNNPGFGVPLDLLFAFFWGFGLPTTVGALAPGSSVAALNISVPKS